MSEAEVSSSAYEGYTAVEVDGVRHWIKNGHAIEDLAYVFKERLDIKKGRPYFINLKEKASVWKLPTTAAEDDAGPKEKKKKKSDADKEEGEASSPRSAKKSSSRSSSSSKKSKASNVGEVTEAEKNTDESKKKKTRSKSANSSEGDALSPTASASNTPREKRNRDKPSRASSPHASGDALVSSLSPLNGASPASGISKVRKKSPSSSKSRALLDAALAKATSSEPFQSEPTDGSAATLASGDAGAEGPASPSPASKKRVAGTKVKAKKKSERASHEDESISSLLASLKPKTGEVPPVGLLGEVDAMLGTGKGSGGGEEGGIDDILSQLTSFERRVNKSDTPAPTRGGATAPAEVIRQTLQADAEERAEAAEALEARIAQTGGVSESEGQLKAPPSIAEKAGSVARDINESQPNNGSTYNHSNSKDIVMPGERAVSLSSIASAVPLVSVPTSPVHVRQTDRVERPPLDRPKKSGDDSPQPHDSTRPSFLNPFKSSALNTNSDVRLYNVEPQPSVVEDSSKSTTATPKNVFNPFATDAFPSISSSTVRLTTIRNDPKEEQKESSERSSLGEASPYDLPETKPPALSRNAKAFAALWDDIATSSASVGARTQAALASFPPPSSESLRSDPRNTSSTTSPTTVDHMAVALGNSPHPQKEQVSDVHAAPSPSVFDEQKEASLLSRGRVKDEDIDDERVRSTEVTDLKSTRSDISSGSNGNARVVDEQQQQRLRGHTKGKGKDDDDEEEAFLGTGTGPTARTDNAMGNAPERGLAYSKFTTKATDDIRQTNTTNSNTKGILKPTSPLMSPHYAFLGNGDQTSKNSFPFLMNSGGTSDGTADRLAVSGANNNSFSSSSQRPITPRRSAASRVVKFVDLLSDDPLAAENNSATSEVAPVRRKEKDAGGSLTSSHAFENTNDLAVLNDDAATSTTGGAGGTLQPPSYFPLSSLGSITGSRLEDDPEYANAFASAAAMASSKNKTKKEASVRSDMTTEADIVSFEEIIGPVIEKSQENVPHIDVYPLRDFSEPPPLPLADEPHTVGDWRGTHSSSPLSVEGKYTDNIGLDGYRESGDGDQRTREPLVLSSAVTSSCSSPLLILEELEESSSTVGLQIKSAPDSSAIDTRSIHGDPNDMRERQSIYEARGPTVEDKGKKQSNLSLRRAKEEAAAVEPLANYGPLQYDCDPRGESVTPSGALDEYLTAAEIELQGLLLRRLSHVEAKKLAITRQITTEWNTSHTNDHSRPLGGENEEAMNKCLMVKNFREDVSAEEGAEELAQTREANMKRKAFRRAIKSSIYESFISLLEEGFPPPFPSGCDGDENPSPLSFAELDRRIRSRDGVVSKIIDGWLKTEREREMLTSAHTRLLQQ